MMKNLRYAVCVLFAAMAFLSACQPKESGNTLEFRKEFHSFSNFDVVRAKHLLWNVNVDFEHKQIEGMATWYFDNPKKEKFIHFDTYDLTIKKIKVNNKEVQYFLTPELPDFGSGLSIPIQENDSMVTIEYHTGPKASALQWLSPAQTAGKKMPFLFTQCESIHARSLLPCQDVPANRITYEAIVGVPKGMMAIMSAKNPTEKTADGIYNFTMEIPVPTYLIALAAGDLAYKAIDARTGVYSEPGMLDKSATELSDVPAMMQAAEALGGPYRWGKYDVLIAPPSFPIGGMENPRLTFATPTIIAGDKSLVSLIAHEMAHSWSGNLVTNARWNDLWLNEGFTTYFERRIMEKISGADYNEMMWELGFQDLQSDLKAMGDTHPDTRLQVDLTGRHPGDAFSNIPYEKGAVFLRMLEINCGRERFDKFMNAYFTKHAFIPTTTADCLHDMDSLLFDGDTVKRNALLVRDWIFKPGLPANCPIPQPRRFVAVDSTRKLFEGTLAAKQMNTAGWTTHEWLQFLRKLPTPVPYEKMRELDLNFHFSTAGNCEIADEWYRVSLASGYEEAYGPMKEFLKTVGRKKFLEPLYGEMIKTPKGRAMATAIFKEAKDNYHPQTAQKIGALLEVK